MFKITLFIFVLMVVAACKGGGGSPTSGNPPSETIPSGPTYTVTGTITYDSIPITATGLNYIGVIQKPVRNVKIQARNVSGNGLLANGTTDDSGAFSLAIPQSATNYYVAVISQMATPSVTIEDNSNSNAVYLVQSASKVNSGDTDIGNIRLTSGWSGTNNGGSYSTPRYSAPFAILDTIYTGYKKMVAARGDFNLPALKVNWSVNNYASQDYDPSTGEIVTSHYDGSELYILGQANSDSDEFDHHVIVHEWGHFVEDKVSRSDSLGGSHGTGDQLHISLAFGEGWGNALSAMILDPETTYRDSMGIRQQTIAVSMNMESGSDPVPGWFSEASVQQLLFDVYDSNSDGADTLTLGLGPIIDVLKAPQKTNAAFTSIFSFMTGLKSQNPGSVGAIDTLTTGKNISNIADIYGSTETNDGNDPDSLPVYNQMVNATPITLDLGGRNYRMNEQNNNRFFTFTATSASTRLNITCSAYCIVGVFSSGSFVSEAATTSSTILNVNTVSGRQYTVLLTTDPDELSNTNPITTTLRATAL